MIKPLGNRVLVQPQDAPEVSAGGILIPKTVGEKGLRQGVVIATGPGKRMEDGTLLPMSVEVDNLIVLPKYGGTDIEMDGEKYVLVNEDEILGLVVD